MSAMSVNYAVDDAIKRIENFMSRNKIKGKWQRFDDDDEVRLIIIQVAKECQRSPELVSACVSALRMADGGARLQLHPDEQAAA